MTSPSSPNTLGVQLGQARLEDVLDPAELAVMSERDIARSRAQIERGVLRPCPGLHGAQFCGEEKEPNAGYCTKCRKLYQKVRYQQRKTVDKVGDTADAIRHYRLVHGPNGPKAAVACQCCGSFDTPSLGIINDVAHPPICRKCFDVVDTLLNNFSPKQILTVLEFVMAVPELVDSMRYVREKHERIIEVCFDRWYRTAKADAQDLRDMMPHKAAEIPDPSPKDFVLDQRVYDEVAQKLGYNDIFKRPLLNFELINRNTAV